MPGSRLIDIWHISGLARYELGELDDACPELKLVAASRKVLLGKQDPPKFATVRIEKLTAEFRPKVTGILYDHKVSQGGTSEQRERRPTVCADQWWADAT